MTIWQHFLAFSRGRARRVQGTALAGRRFETLEAQNEFLRHWEENWASKRIHGSTRRQVEAMFQEEKPHLRPLPVAPFRIFTEVVRTVCDDTTVRVDSSYYAARPAALRPKCRPSRNGPGLESLPTGDSRRLSAPTKSSAPCRLTASSF